MGALLLGLDGINLHFHYYYIWHCVHSLSGYMCDWSLCLYYSLTSFLFVKLHSFDTEKVFFSFLVNCEKTISYKLSLCSNKEWLSLRATACLCCNSCCSHPPLQHLCQKCGTDHVGRLYSGLSWSVYHSQLITSLKQSISSEPVVFKI